MLGGVFDGIDVRWLLTVLAVALGAGGAGFLVGMWLGS